MTTIKDRIMEEARLIGMDDDNMRIMSEAIDRCMPTCCNCVNLWRCQTLRPEQVCHNGQCASFTRKRVQQVD